MAYAYAIFPFLGNEIGDKEFWTLNQLVMALSPYQQAVTSNVPLMPFSDYNKHISECLAKNYLPAYSGKEHNYCLCDSDYFQQQEV